MPIGARHTSEYLSRERCEDSRPPAPSGRAVGGETLILFVRSAQLPCSVSSSRAVLVPGNTVQLQGRQIACAPQRSEPRLFKNKNGQPAVSLASCGAQQTGSNLLSRETPLGDECSAKPKHKTLWASLKTRTHPLACGLISHVLPCVLAGITRPFMGLIGRRLVRPPPEPNPPPLAPLVEYLKTG
jgi:hypothetical protein